MFIQYRLQECFQSYNKITLGIVESDSVISYYHLEKGFPTN